MNYFLYIALILSIFTSGINTKFLEQRDLHLIDGLSFFNEDKDSDQHAFDWLGEAHDVIYGHFWDISSPSHRIDSYIRRYESIFPLVFAKGQDLEVKAIIAYAIVRLHFKFYDGPETMFKEVEKYLTITKGFYSSYESDIAPYLLLMSREDRDAVKDINEQYRVRSKQAEDVVLKIFADNSHKSSNMSPSYSLKSSLVNKSGSEFENVIKNIIIPHAILGEQLLKNSFKEEIFRLLDTQKIQIAEGLTNLENIDTFLEGKGVNGPITFPGFTIPFTTLSWFQGHFTSNYTELEDFSDSSIILDPRYNLLNQTLTIRYSGDFPALMLNGEYEMDAHLNITFPIWDWDSSYFCGGNGSYHFGTKNSTIDLFIQIVLPLRGNVHITNIDFELTLGQFISRLEGLYCMYDINLEVWDLMETYWRDWMRLTFKHYVTKEFAKCELNYIIGGCTTGDLLVGNWDCLNNPFDSLCLL